MGANSLAGAFNLPYSSFPGMRVCQKAKQRPGLEELYDLHCWVAISMLRVTKLLVAVVVSGTSLRFEVASAVRLKMVSNNVPIMISDLPSCLIVLSCSLELWVFDRPLCSLNRDLVR